MLPVVFPKAEVPPHGNIFNDNGELVIPAILEEDFISVWEDRHSYKNQKRDYLKAEMASDMGNTLPLKKINQEFYCRVTSDFERLIPDKCIKWKDVSSIYSNAQDYYWYITSDFTTTGNKDSDDSGVILWAIDYTETFYLMEISLSKKKKDVQYRVAGEYAQKAFRKGASWVDIGIEIDGQQIMHLWRFDEYCQENSIPITFAKQMGATKNQEGIRSKKFGDKLERLKLVQPDFERGKVVFNKLYKTGSVDMATLISEIKMTTHTEIKSTDNGIDSVSMLRLIDIEVPPKPREMEKDKKGYNSEYTKYSYL
jgi:hypothetical protein